MSAKLAIDLYRSILLGRLEAELQMLKAMPDTDFWAGEFAAFRTALQIVKETDPPAYVGVSYRGRPSKPSFKSPSLSIEGKETWE